MKNENQDISFDIKIRGLTTEQVNASRKKYGTNFFEKKEESGFGLVLKNVVTEPMFLLLLVGI